VLDVWHNGDDEFTVTVFNEKYEQAGTKTGPIK